VIQRPGKFLRAHNGGKTIIMAGKRRKPIDQLVYHRPHRKIPDPIHLDPIPDGVSIPPCPPNLHPKGEEAWDLFWRSPIRQLLQPIDVPLVERWAFCLSERETLEEQLADNPFVTGPRGGQPKLNPAIRLLRLYIDEIHRLEERLGIGLLSRMRLGIAMGTADKARESRHDRYREPKEPEWVTISDDGEID
jgi:P27 family predicted phage terminase small subunit